MDKLRDCACLVKNFTHSSEIKVTNQNILLEIPYTDVDFCLIQSYQNLKNFCNNLLQNNLYYLYYVQNFQAI